jgi:hypothetical protein
VAKKRVVDKGERREKRKRKKEMEGEGGRGGTEEGNREGHGTKKSGLMSRHLGRRRLG